RAFAFESVGARCASEWSTSSERPRKPKSSYSVTDGPRPWPGPGPGAGAYPSSRADETAVDRPIWPRFAYWPRSSVTQRPRKYASEQSCQLPRLITTDEARSLKPWSARLWIELYAP